MTKPKAYMFISIKTDGDSILHNNILSIGMSCRDEGGELICCYGRNIFPALPTYLSDEVIKYYTEYKELWNEITCDCMYLLNVCIEISEMFETVSKNYSITFVASPSCFVWSMFRTKYGQFNLSYKLPHKCICFSTIMEMYALQNKQMSNLKLNKTKHMIPVNESHNQLLNFLLFPTTFNPKEEHNN
jgi:hypothetical protein